MSLYINTSEHDVFGTQCVPRWYFALFSHYIKSKFFLSFNKIFLLVVLCGLEFALEELGIRLPPFPQGTASDP